MRYSGLLLASVLPLALAYEYRVGVGKDETTGRKGMGFDPSVIHPTLGDVIAFEFRSGVHSVVQSTFDNPCVSNGGFNSGVHTVADDVPVDDPSLPIVRLTVNSSDPLWFFDEAGGLCYQGAVLAANPTAAQSAAVFKENAALPPKPASFSTTPASTGAAPSANSAAATNTPASGAARGISSGAWCIAAASLVLGAVSLVA